MVLNKSILLLDNIALIVLDILDESWCKIVVLKKERSNLNE